MRTIPSLGFIVLAGFLFSGCIRAYYVPASHNVPLLTEKKQARVSANFYYMSREIFNVVPGFELQGSYAVTNHLGVMGNLLTAGKNLDSVSLDAKYGDLGVGYFTTVLNKKVVFEVYGGYGLGSTQNRFENNAFSATEFSKVFIQPAMGFKSRYFDFAISWRYASISHSSLRLAGTLPDYGVSEFELLTNNPTYTVSEPAITFRFGNEVLKFQIQNGASVYTGQGEPYTRLFGNASLILMLPIKPVSSNQ